MEFLLANLKTIIIVFSSLYILPALAASIFFWIKLGVWISFNPEDRDLILYPQALKVNNFIKPLRRVGLFFMLVMFGFLVYSSISGVNK